MHLKFPSIKKGGQLGIFILLNLLFSSPSNAQDLVYSIDARTTVNEIRIGHLKVGGTSPKGVALGANSRFFTKNDKPWFPIMGEFHYCRYPYQDWEEEIIKMKSAGLSIISVYVFWNAHENPKEIWHWDKDLDLKRFVELCRKNEMKVWLRIGPYAHGEQLYGGLPKWINDAKGERTNDPVYLKEASKLFRQIGQQTKGLYFKEGGPIIGVQLENEYASGEAGHIKTLKDMAIAAGIHPVYFSVTANTVFDSNNFEVIPLQGAYPYRGWEKAGGGLTKEFLYAEDKWIMADAFGKTYYDVNQYPRGLCEEGAGSQMTYVNRFVVKPEVIEAEVQNQLGKGMNFIGYYMFQGGTQMPGLEEPGYPRSYDFQAPISEFGLLRPSYKYLKILHNFIGDFGEDLAKTAVIFPSNPLRDETNKDSLRYIARVNGNHGYIFLCNTQKQLTLSDKTFRLHIDLPDEKLEFPRHELHLKGSTIAILPFNLNINNAILKYATVQPLARINKDNEQFVFFTKVEGMNVELAFDSASIRKLTAKNWRKMRVDGKIYLTPNDTDAAPVKIVSTTGQSSTLILLTRRQAENSWRTRINNQDRLIISKADLMFYDSTIECRQLENPTIKFDVFPSFEKPLNYKGKSLIPEENGIFRHYNIFLRKVVPDVKISKVAVNKLVVRTASHLPPTLSDIILKIQYNGDHVVASIGNKIATDNLFNGRPWLFGLKRYMKEMSNGGVKFQVFPWSDKVTGISDSLIHQLKSEPNQINSLQVIPQYQAKIKVN